MYKIDYFEIFSEILFIEDKFFVIPELCKWLEWNDEIFTNHLRRFVSSKYHTDIHSSSYLYPTSMELFEQLKKFNYFSIFSGIPNIAKVASHNDFCQNKLYQEVVDNLIFLGWNPRCSIGSAITDGYYPIVIAEGKYFVLDERFSVNKYGLLDSEEDANEICRINNEFSTYNEGDLFYSTQVYVDKNTFEYMKYRLALVNI